MTAPNPRSAAPSEALVARFDAALQRLWPDGGKLGLAVSGGPDSLAMLLLAEAAIPGRFEVATVDHGLRPEAADECAMVAEVCAERGIPCEVLAVEVGEGNVQASARNARYEALLGWAMDREINALATAHHADDQAETLLMRLNRASGVAGLAGVREVTSVGQWIPDVIRPLLHFLRVELLDVVERAGLTPVQDPSNADDRFDRVRIRKALADADWLDIPALAASAVNLADAEDAIEWCVMREWTEQAEGSREEVRYRGYWDTFGHLSFVPHEIIVRIVQRAVGCFGGAPTRRECAALAARLMQDEGGNLAGVLATVEGKQWVFRREPPRRTG
jgi:tRNA(Ile)-lysidine synthase